eukprot:s839_g3.t1
MLPMTCVRMALCGECRKRSKVQATQLAPLQGSWASKLAWSLAATLGPSLTTEAWAKLLQETFRLIQEERLDDVSLAVAAHSLYRLRDTPFAPGRHGGATNCVAALAAMSSQRLPTMELRLLVDTTAWLARLAGFRRVEFL